MALDELPYDGPTRISSQGCDCQGVVEILDGERFAPHGVAHDLDRTGHPLWGLSPSWRLTRFLQIAKGRLRYKLSRRSFFDYFDDARVIFIHVPKNAGSSIKKELYDDGPIGHRSAQFVRALDPVKFQAYLVFTTVRHPRHRVMSAFQYLKYAATGERDRTFCERHLADIPDFASFSQRFRDPVFRSEILSWPHFREQTQYICDPDGRLLVDLLVAVERLDVAQPYLERLVAKPLPLGRVNVSPKANLSDAALDWTAVDAVYAEDMRLWQRVMQSRIGLARRASSGL